MNELTSETAPVLDKSAACILINVIYTYVLYVHTHNTVFLFISYLPIPAYSLTLVKPPSCY